MPRDPLLHAAPVYDGPARILLTGDQALIRSALRLLIASSGMTVVGECSNQPDAVRAAMTAVDLVVMDLDLDATWLSRTEMLGQLLAAPKGSPVVIVTKTDNGPGISFALQNGAFGVVLKNRPADVLIRAIRTVLAGEVWLERSKVNHAFAKSELFVVPQRLTRRESQVVELIRLGLQNKKIAERLSITETTVRHHLTSIFEKLDVTNRLELMHYTYKTGADVS